ncbi:MAG: hypothetical protein HC824_04265 [Synechococcales cyanobacterium RM1_1_8]|nr:hypothetical protein [Synechococcales cyanobacterium RM1_1_8]
MTDPKAEQRKANGLGEFLQGAGLAIALYLVIYAGLWVALYTADLLAYVLTGVPNSSFTQGLYQLWLFGIFAFGLVQWLYVLPVVWWLQGEGKGVRVRGLVAVAIALSLLNGLLFVRPGLWPMM